jgi:hypothetical protein
VTWARGQQIANAWRVCPRGDWLLAIAVRLGASPESLVAAAAAAAATALDFMPDGETRAGEALRVANAWARGEADEAAVAAALGSIEELASSARDAAVEAAAEAVRAALLTTDDPGAAASAASHAGQAAVFDAGDCAMLAALRFAQEQAANAVRTHLDAPWAARAFDELAPH